MKKKMFIMACLAVLGIQVVKAQIAALALHHQGNVTMYNGSKISDALTAAADGDTIYISSGILSSDITITKKLTFIGAGSETVVRGTISVAIPETPTLTSRLLQDLKVDGLIRIDSPIKGVLFSRCQFTDIDFKAEIYSSSIDNCICWGSFILRDKIDGLEVITTKINNVAGDCATADNAHFINCNIRHMWNSPWTEYTQNDDHHMWNLATYVNCIILSYSQPGQNYKSATSYVNCLFRDNSKSWKDCANYGCWNNNALVFDDEYNASFSNESDWANYVGTDATVVGVTGTANPFNNNPSTPRVLTHTLGVNEAGTSLSVSLTVGN